MGTGAQVWSTAAASNNSADSNVNWAEGMAPSAVNNSARAEMASAKMWIVDNSGSLLTTGSTSAYTVTSKQVSTGLVDGYTVAVNFHATNDSAATLNVDAQGAKNLQLISGTNVSGGEFRAGTTHRFRYSTTSTAWVEVSPTVVSSNVINDGSISYAKLQNETNGTILGNASGSAAAPYELTVGTGLSLSTGAISAPAFPPASAYKNLVIKVTGNSSASITADFVTLATSGSSSFITLPCSSEINFGSNGSANALDTGALAANTSYAIYAIAASATSTHADGLASTSFTTPTMPSGYTYKARIGALVTSTSTAGTLMGTWQFGSDAQYKMGLAATGTTLPFIASGAVGTFNTTTFTATAESVTGNLVPTTACKIKIIVSNTNNSGAVGVAPSASFQGYATSAPPPLVAITVGEVTQGELILESTAVYYASAIAGGRALVLGWTDNI